MDEREDSRKPPARPSFPAADTHAPPAHVFRRVTRSTAAAALPASVAAAAAAAAETAAVMQHEEGGVDFPFQWPATRMWRVQHCKAEKNFVRNQKKHFPGNGICSFPDQANIEECSPFLMREKEKFDRDSELAKEHWDRMVAAWKKENKVPSDPKVESTFESFVNTCKSSYRLTIIGFKLEDDSFHDYYMKALKDSNDSESFDSIDIRFWRVIYRKDFEKRAKYDLKTSIRDNNGRLNNLVGHLRPVVNALFNNLVHVLPPQEQGHVPVVSEIAFLSWGTKAQKMHSDFPITDLIESEDGVAEWVGTYPKNVEMTKWYGTALYHFFDKDLPVQHAPCLLVQPPLKNIVENGKLKKGAHRRERKFTQQKFITFFGPHVTHGGGGHSRAFIRMHVHFDPPENPKDSTTLRLPAKVMHCDPLPEPEDDATKMMRIAQEKKDMANGGLTKPHYFPGLYPVGFLRENRGGEQTFIDACDPRPKKKPRKKGNAATRKNPPKTQKAPPKKPPPSSDA